MESPPRMAKDELLSESEFSQDPPVYNKIWSQEIEELRMKLNEGHFRDYFSWTFWNTLHSYHGNTLGYTFGFLLILSLNYHWMLEEFVDANEGHSVAKTFVILFVIYAYSFITMGVETIQLVLMILEMYCPTYCQELQELWSDILNESKKLKELHLSKYFYTPFVVLWFTFTAFIGSIVWKWFWWNHICKSYHDRTCKGSWLGQLVIQYRDEACYDGTRSSMFCERLISYLPIMIFCVFVVFMGNVFMPILNDWVSSLRPMMSESLKSAFEIVDKLNDETISKSETLIDSSSVELSTQITPGDFMASAIESLCTKRHEKDHGYVSITEKNMEEHTLRKMIPAGFGVAVLLLLDWIIVKKFF